MLYLPGSNRRALEKAKSLDADVLIFDLEDAVAPEAKSFARDQVVAAIAAGGLARREIVIRVNPLETPWGLQDIEAACRAGPDAVLVPKIAKPEDVMSYAREMREADVPIRTRLWAMMETPLAILNARDIAATASDSASRLDAFVMGTNDLAKETRARLVPGRAPMLTYLAISLAAARSRGLDLIDGVYNEIADPEGFLAECRQGRDLGMDGKSLIHPSQIEVCNDVFTPDADEVEWATKVLVAFDIPENAKKNVLMIDGRMVERLHAEMARRTLAIAEAIAGRS